MKSLVETLLDGGEEDVISAIIDSEYIRSVFCHVVASRFFPAYAPGVKSWRKKLSGKNSNGNPVLFTPQDREEISRGLRRLTADLLRDLPI